MNQGKPSRAREMAYEELPEENELMLIDEENGEVRVLNSEAGGIWLLCNGERTVEDIAHFLAGMFPSMNYEQLSDKVDETLHMLADQGLIVR